MIRGELIELLKKKGFEGKVDHPGVEKFGDYAVRADVDLEPDDLIEKTEKVAGFTNIFIKKEALLKEVEKLNYEIELKNELATHGKGKTMVIDYSAPNIAKPFGIGHLRSTDIGQAIYNIYKILGWKCIGDNHLGDWGTQFGKLIVAIKKWNEKAVEELSIDDLERLYVKFHTEAEKNPEMEDEAREWFVKLENGEAEAKDIWQKCIEISLKEFDKVYEVLGVKIDQTLGESFYLDKMPAVIEAMEKKGITKKSEGAEIIEFKNMSPAMVKKSNETTTYFTRDMATVKYRIEKWKPDLIIYEVGSDQILHFRQVFETAKMLGYRANFVHVAHGMMRWATGKFSTRKGDTIHLSEVIEKAMEEAKKIAPENTKEKIMAVAIGAIKFNDLSQDPKKDIIFDWERVMSMDGNSGPYLQYTYARCQSVLEKTKILEQKNINEVPIDFKPEEMSLVRELSKFEEKLVESAERFNPAVIAEYLLLVARKYNEFYGKYRIIGETEEVWRIFLTKTTSSVLKLGLELLGIKTIEKM
ncbi:MAG: arginine--tRNA ligase [Candidatus Shapirobacteria bacterium]|nr:arginine--tRNA ligase [Candidatus Shapirobacteria bacterium]